MKRPAFGPREENRLIEWRGSRKHPNDRPGRGVDDQARHHPGLFVMKVEAEEELSLSGAADSGQKRPLPKGGA